MNYWRGTGFFVGEEGEDPEYIVTNSHVVEEFILAGKALGGGTLHVLFDQDDEAEAYLVDYDYEKDIRRAEAGGAHGQAILPPAAGGGGRHAGR